MGTPHKRFQLQTKCDSDWCDVFDIQGSFNYCLGAFHLGDSFYPAPPYRIINAETFEVVKESKGRGEVGVS
jgi:hypothetical protein